MSVNKIPTEALSFIRYKEATSLILTRRRIQTRRSTRR